MKNILNIENHTFLTEGESVESNFVRLFSKIPNHTITLYEMDMENYTQVGEFVKRCIDFFAEHSTNITTSVYNSQYDGKFMHYITLYGENALMVIRADMKEMAVGITKETFHTLINNKADKISISFDSDSQFGKEVYEKCFDQCTTIKSKGNKEASFNIIEAASNGSLYIDKINVKIEDDIDIDLMYNDGFEDVHENILRNLREESTGLIMLHGGIGCGKTSYIRRLIIELSSGKKQVIYMPPDMANSISSPSFMKFLREHKNSIIVIEDAENILKSREAGANSSVANILNTTDGLMGDALQLHFICTFNADKQDIDQALFRPGRLLQEYKFDKLTVDKAKKLWDSLGKPSDEFPDTEMSIAEIFNHNDRIEIEEKKKGSFGFTPES